MTMTVEQENLLLARVADLEAREGVITSYLNALQANGLDPVTTDGGMRLSNTLARLLTDNVVEGYSGNQVTILGELDTRSLDVVHWVFGELMSNLIGSHGRLTISHDGTYPGFVIDVQDAAGTVIARTTWTPTGGIVVYAQNGSQSATGTFGATGLVQGGAIVDSGFFELSGVVTPSQVTSNQNNYDPGGWANIPPTSQNSWFRLDSDAARDLTGLHSPPVGFEQGFVCLLHYIGANSIVLKDENASSTATNRFALSGDITLTTDQCAILQYDNTTQRWRCVGTSGTISGLYPSTGGGSGWLGLGF